MFHQVIVLLPLGVPPLTKEMVWNALYMIHHEQGILYDRNYTHFINSDQNFNANSFHSGLELYLFFFYKSWTSIESMACITSYKKINKM